MCTCIINQDIKAKHGNLFVLSFCDHFYSIIYQLCIFLRDKDFELCTHIIICYIYIMLTSKNELNVLTLRF